MDKQARLIDVLLFDGVNLLDIAGPVQAFSEARLNGQRAYALRFYAPGSQQATSITTSCGLQLMTTDIALMEHPANDLLVPGGQGINAQLGKLQWRQLIQQWLSSREDARLISVCSGAMLLADAGVLDNRQATTHWSREVQARRSFPLVDWQLDRISVRDDAIFTSAGVTTGIDLALSIIRIDCGIAAALSVARELVVYLQRSGGQTQYAQIVEWQFSAHDSIASLVNTLIDNPGKQWTLDMMASEAAMTSRTLTRRFTASFNTSPMKFLERIRVRLAGDMLSAGVPIARVARFSGFGDVQSLRRAYKRQLGTTLGNYIDRFTNPS